MNKKCKIKNGRIQTSQNKRIKSAKGKSKCNANRLHYEKWRLIVWFLIDVIIIGLLALEWWHHSVDMHPLLTGIGASLWEVKTAIVELMLSVISATMHHSSQTGSSKTTS
jgi:hypothetical protein